jgi:hypothetical protein
METTLLNNRKFDRDEFTNLWNLSSAHFCGKLPVAGNNRLPILILSNLVKGVTE